MQLYDPRTEMNFCRRCGSKLTQLHGESSHIFQCEQKHIIFCNASPAIGLFIRNKEGQILLIRRGIQPCKGMLDAAGGFCDGLESGESAVAREMQEELGLTPDQYSTPQLIVTLPNRYEYKGEILPTFDLFYVATLREDVEPVADDDVASLEWWKLADINPEDLAFESTRQVVDILRKQES